MDPRHLVQLATILEHCSISQASRHLHLTQPTLTHNMQVLEMQAGGKLFFPVIREDGLTDEEHVENATRIFLEGLRPGG